MYVENPNPGRESRLFTPTHACPQHPLLPNALLVILFHLVQRGGIIFKTRRQFLQNPDPLKKFERSKPKSAHALLPLPISRSRALPLSLALSPILLHSLSLSIYLSLPHIGAHQTHPPPPRPFILHLRYLFTAVNQESQK